MALRFGKTQRFIGLDIGTSSIKLVQLSKEQKQLVLETYGIAHRELDIVHASSEQQIRDAADIIKQIVDRAGVTTNKVIASFPIHAVFVSVFELPNIPEKELKAAVEYEARRYVPVALEKLVLSWNRLESTEPGKVRVLLTAVPTELVDRYVRMFRRAGLDPVALEVESLSLARSLTEERGKHHLILDIGSGVTGMNIFNDGALVLSKSIGIAGRTISDQISENLGISYTAAEQFKLDLAETEKTLPPMMAGVIDQLLGEVDRFLRLYQRQQRNPLTEVILAGGGSKLPGIQAYISQQLGLPVVTVDPLATVRFPEEARRALERVAPFLPVAIGSAKREFTL